MSLVTIVEELIKGPLILIGDEFRPQDKEGRRLGELQNGDPGQVKPNEKYQE